MVCKVNNETLKYLESLRQKWNEIKSINLDFTLKNVLIQFIMCDERVIEIKTDDDIVAENSGRIYKFVGNPYFYGFTLNNKLIDIETLTGILTKIWKDDICGFSMWISTTNPWNPVGAWKFFIHGVLENPNKGIYGIRVEISTVIDGIEYVLREYGKYMEIKGDKQ